MRDVERNSENPKERKKEKAAEPEKKDQPVTDQQKPPQGVAADPKDALEKINQDLGAKKKPTKEDLKKYV